MKKAEYKKIETFPIIEPSLPVPADVESVQRLHSACFLHLHEQTHPPIDRKQQKLQQQRTRTSSFTHNLITEVKS